MVKYNFMIILFTGVTCRPWRDVVHFGLGKTQVIDTILIEWPDGNIQTFYNTKVNQVLEAKYSDSQKNSDADTSPPSRVYFQEVSRLWSVKFKHKEWDKIHFLTQRTLPHKFSQAGPAIAIGDVNGDGLEILLSADLPSTILQYIRSMLNGSFTILRSLRPRKKNRKMRDCCFSMQTTTKISIFMLSAEVMKEILILIDMKIDYTAMMAKVGLRSNVHCLQQELAVPVSGQPILMQTVTSIICRWKSCCRIVSRGSGKLFTAKRSR